MAARKKGRRKKARRRNKVKHLPTTAAWQKRWEKATGKKIKKIKVSPSQWRSRYRKRTATKAKWKVKPRSKSRRRGASPARSRFRKAVRRGVLKSTKLNPFTPEQWARKYARKTGYYPRIKRGRAAPGTKRWLRRTKRGIQQKSKAWYQGALAAAERQLRATGKRRAANPYGYRRKKSRRKKRRRNAVAKYRYPMVRSAAARRMMKAAMRPKRRRRRRRRNPLDSYLGAALPTYGYVLGGAVAGGVLPSAAVALARKAGLDLGGYGTVVDAGLGVALSIGAGMLVGKYKGDSKGVLVAAGGIGTVIGKLLIKAVGAALPEEYAMAGLGQDADAMLREAVDVELRKAGLSGGMGQFLMPRDAEEVPDVGPMDGMGQFLTSPEMHEAIGEGQISGLGEDIGRGDLTDDGTAAFDGSVF
jgi:hypothetical protein